MFRQHLLCQYLVSPKRSRHRFVCTEVEIEQEMIYCLLSSCIGSLLTDTPHELSMHQHSGFIQLYIYSFLTPKFRQVQQ